MTREEMILISAYTGDLFCDAEELREYAEKIMKRPVFPHEMTLQGVVWETLKKESEKRLKDIAREIYESD